MRLIDADGHVEESPATFSDKYLAPAFRSQRPQVVGWSIASNIPGTSCPTSCVKQFPRRRCHPRSTSGEGMQIVYGSVMPHANREHFAGRLMQERKDISTSAKLKILEKNSCRLYQLTIWPQRRNRREPEGVRSAGIATSIGALAMELTWLASFMQLALPRRLAFPHPFGRGRG